MAKQREKVVAVIERASSRIVQLEAQQLKERTGERTQQIVKLKAERAAAFEQLETLPAAEG